MTFPCFLLLLIICINPVYNLVDVLYPDENQKEVLHDTVRHLLKIYQEDDQTVKRSVTKSDRAASKYMRRLFEKYKNHEIKENGEAGTIVRTLTPKIGRFQDRDALLFDLHPVGPSEIVTTAELHYYVGGHGHKNGKLSRKIHCFVLSRSSPNEKESKFRNAIRSSDIELVPKTSKDDPSSKWLVFDALNRVTWTLGDSNKSQSEDVVNSSHTLPRLLAVMFAKSSGPEDGHRLRVPSVQKVLQHHAPFLSISTLDTVGLSMAVDPITDKKKEEGIEKHIGHDRSMEEANHDRSIEPNRDHDRLKGDHGRSHSPMINHDRHKRSIDTKYYEYYHPFETPYTTSPNDVVGIDLNANAENDVQTTATFIQRGPSILRRNTDGKAGRSGKKRSRKHRRWGKRYLDDEYENVIWDPLEMEDGKADKRRNKYGMVLNPRDDQDPTAVVLLEQNPDAAAGTCQRNDLVVDFRDIGWGDYVIAPSSFEAHYCSGSCHFPVSSSVNATNHAIVLDIIQKIHLHPKIPRPCCAPDKMDSLSLLYYDSSGNVVLTTYPKMSVVSCACL